MTFELDIAAVRAAWELPFEQGLAMERAISDGSLQTPESRAMRHLFFAERAVADVPGIGPRRQATQHRQRRHHRLRDDGWRHRDGLCQCRHSRGAAGRGRGRAGARPWRDPQELRRQRQARHA